MEKRGFCTWSVKPIEVPASVEEYATLGNVLDEDLERVLTAGKLAPELLAYLAIARAALALSRDHPTIAKDLCLQSLTLGQSTKVKDLIRVIFQAAWRRQD